MKVYISLRNLTCSTNGSYIIGVYNSLENAIEGITNDIYDLTTTGNKSWLEFEEIPEYEEHEKNLEEFGETKIGDFSYQICEHEVINE
uniref:Uncharacterized protein n=1 Tax=Pithovirus LCPAC406 TaxID=2506599 RepID=A0A481ZER4_9VIRU|nr:MAG: hypothetical protein LCPAC406_04000 [Pithovirus LCPAC406]